MTYTAYFDESGTHDGSPAVSVAGYVSTDDRWTAFGADWRCALDEFELGYFHMTDFANRAGRYASWTEGERRDRFERLVAIINKHAMASVGTVIQRELYERLVTGAARQRSGGLYGLAAVSCAMTMDKRLPTAPDQQVAYVFESGAPGHGQLERILRDNMHDPEAPDHVRIVSVGFENKRQLTPLQAADILAYELYKHLPRQLGLDHRPIRRTNLEQLAHIPHDWGVLDEAQLKQFAYVITIALQFGTGTWQTATNPTVPSTKRRTGLKSKHDG